LAFGRQAKPPAAMARRTGTLSGSSSAQPTPSCSFGIMTWRLSGSCAAHRPVNQPVEEQSRNGHSPAMPPSPRIVSVLLPQPLPQPVDSDLPEGVEGRPGAFVVVPLGPREVIGVVWAERPAPSNRKLKAVVDVIASAPPLSSAMRTFIERASK